MDVHSPIAKKAAQEVCRICSTDVSSRSINRFNLFRGTPPLCSQVENALQLETNISIDDGLPKSICRPCKTSVENILKFQKTQQDLKRKYTSTCGQIRKKRLAQTPTDKRAEEHMPRKTAAVESPGGSARKLSFSASTVGTTSVPPVEHSESLQWPKLLHQSSLRAIDHTSSVSNVQVLTICFKYKCYLLWLLHIFDILNCHPLIGCVILGLYPVH